MTSYAIAPILLAWSGDTIRMFFLAPHVRKVEVVNIWKRYKREIVGVGILSDCAYLLVLWAYNYASVSRVAPMREVSILVGVGLASWHLKEKDLKKRLPAAAVIVVGVVLLAVAR